MFSRIKSLFFGVYAVLRYHPRRIPMILEAGLTLMWARLLTWLRPFHAYRAKLSASALHGRPIDELRLAEVVWAVSRLGTLAPQILNCLPQALTVQTMLRRRGTEGDLCFGVKITPEGQVKAHAWVEWEGRPIIGKLPDLDAYSRLPSWPG